MIKKNTKAIFLDGDFKGEYDWKGGIPLSKGEFMNVRFKGNLLRYKLTKKEITCDVEDKNQIIYVLYIFNLV